MPAGGVKSMLGRSGSTPGRARCTWFEAHDPISHLVFDRAELLQQTIDATVLRKKALARLMHFLDDGIFDHCSASPSSRRAATPGIGLDLCPGRAFLFRRNSHTTGEIEEVLDL